MASFHRWIGISLVVAFLLLSIYGGLARLFRREGLGRPFWGLLYYTETVLVIQIVVGVVMLFMGRRVPTAGLQWLHYFYGSLFPLVAVIGGRMYSLRRRDADRDYEYVPIAFAALIAFGLTFRALTTGDPAILSRLFGA